jgi:hypothetical protein
LTSISERDAQRPRCAHEIQVRRHESRLTHDILQRNRDDIRRPIRHHPAKFAIENQLHCLATKSRGEHPIEARRLATTLQVP